MSLVLRHQWESYMDCGNEGEIDYQLIGEGFTSFPEAKNPKKYTRKYHEDKTEQTDVISYSPSMSYSCDVITGNPVVEKIIDITDREQIGLETHVAIVSVNLWKETDVVGTYIACKRYYSIIPDGKGEGTSSLIYTGTMQAVGDVEYGTFERKSRIFTPDEYEDDGDEDNEEQQKALCSKTVSPSFDEQYVAPDAGYYGLSFVIVEAIDDTVVIQSEDGTTNLICEIVKE